jgi:outer membrane protein assembly factor BamD (BamD/ComL family)
MEDDAAEVLYTLAEKFKTEGNQGARAETLRYLVERYPSSRFAETAKTDLDELGGKR